MPWVFSPSIIGIRQPNDRNAFRNGQGSPSIRVHFKMSQLLKLTERILHKAH